MHSPLFGEYQEPTITEKMMIEHLIDQCPVGTFQALNKKLNDRGFRISIDVKED